MMRITAEFCPPKQPSRLAWAALAVLTVLSALLWTGVAVQSAEARRARDQAAHLEALAAEARQRQSSASPAPAPWDASARLMLEHAGSRWPQVLTALETSRTPGVLPVALSVNVPAHTATVELQFADYPVLLEYIAQLNASDPSMRWQLVQASADARSGIPSMARATIMANIAAKP